ncbi:response regulator, partial [Kitasatospora sp. NPDC058263]
LQAEAAGGLRERVFEEFYQVRGAHQRGRSGTGLGLPYARRLTGLLGGTLTLTSGPGEGTRVVVRLPVPGPPVEDPPARVAVLVSVDDDEAYRASVRPLLGELAERIVEVSEGGRAVETVRRERPDAVLLDLHMPDLDGYQVLAELAADAELCAVPVVVITSASTAGLEHDRLVHARAVLEKATLRSHQLAAAFAAPARGNHPGDHPGGPVADGRSVR